MFLGKVWNWIRSPPPKKNFNKVQFEFHAQQSLYGLQRTKIKFTGDLHYGFSNRKR